MEREEIARLEAYLKRTFNNPGLELRPQPKKTDMCEVFLSGEFIATLYRIEEDGETEYQMQMAILEMDLEGA